MGLRGMGGKAEVEVAEAKPDHHSHLSHWTKSWNLGSRPRSCWTRTHLDLGEGSPRWADTVAPGPSPAGTPCVGGGGSGGGVGDGGGCGCDWGRRMMYA